MDEFLRRAPRTLIAIVALIVGYFVIMAADPPKTICDEQLSLFMQGQKSFLANQGNMQRSAAAQLYELCRTENGPGGCFDYFLNLKKMVEDLDRIPKNCAMTIGEDPLVRQWLLKSISLMAEIAWGEKPPANPSRRLGWLDAADFRLFCRMKTLATRFYGDEQFHGFREGVMSGLPGAKDLSREQRWSSSIFSHSCER